MGFSRASDAFESSSTVNSYQTAAISDAHTAARRYASAAAAESWKEPDPSCTGRQLPLCWRGSLTFPKPLPSAQRQKCAGAMKRLAPASTPLQSTHCSLLSNAVRDSSAMRRAAHTQGGQRREANGSGEDCRSGSEIHLWCQGSPAGPARNARSLGEHPPGARQKPRSTREGIRANRGGDGRARCRHRGGVHSG